MNDYLYLNQNILFVLINYKDSIKIKLRVFYIKSYCAFFICNFLTLELWKTQLIYNAWQSLKDLAQNHLILKSKLLKYECKFHEKKSSSFPSTFETNAKIWEEKILYFDLKFIILHYFFLL